MAKSKLRYGVDQPDMMSVPRHNPYPYVPVYYDKADQYALIALSQGAATEEQQKRALRWIRFACGDTDVTYRSGSPDADRDMIFIEGRKFVWSQIQKLIDNPGITDGD